MLNWSSFVNRCSIKYASASDFTLLLIRIPDFKMFMKTFGGRFSNSLLRSFSDYLYNFVNLGDGFYLEDECFALMFPKDSEKVGETYRAIRKKLSENWNIGTVDTLITACFMRIDCLMTLTMQICWWTLSSSSSIVNLKLKDFFMQLT